MKQEMILIDRGAVKHLLTLMVRAEGYCRNATSSSQCDIHDEPTCSYPGASGYAGATFRECIQVLETAL